MYISLWLILRALSLPPTIDHNIAIMCRINKNTNVYLMIVQKSPENGPNYFEYYVCIVTKNKL